MKNAIIPSTPTPDALGLTTINEAVGRFVLDALKASATREHPDPDQVFNLNLKEVITLIPTLATPAEQFDVCNRFIGALTRNLVQKVTENFIAVIFLALIFHLNLHAHLLGTHPELKRRREMECFILAQWRISKSEYRISRLCRAGQRALEAILAGLPIPAHPERIISMLKLWDDFLSAYEHLCAAAAGKVPPPKAIKEYMDAWEKAKEAKEGAKTPTLLKRIAEGERALREATKSKHADTKRIDTKRVHQANMDLEALYRALDVAPSAFSVRETTPQELEVVEVPAALAPDAGVKPAPADDPTAAIPAANTGAATPEEDGSTPPAETDLDDVGDGSTPATDAAAIAEQDTPVPGEAANPAAAPVEPAATDFEQGIALELRGTQVLAVLTTMDKPLFDALRERMKDPAALYKFERKEMCRGAQKPGAWIRDFGDATQSTAAYQELVTWARYFGQPPA